MKLKGDEAARALFTDWRQAGPGWVSTSESPGCTHGGMQDLWEKLREDCAEQAKGRMLGGEDGDGLGSVS